MENTTPVRKTWETPKVIKLGTEGTNAVNTTGSFEGTLHLPFNTTGGAKISDYKFVGYKSA